MDSKSDKTIANNKVFKEMIATETTYNSSLKLLEMALTIEVNVQDHPFLKAITPHIRILRSISDQLLAHANKALEPNASEQEHIALRSQRLQLIKAFFVAYRPYAILYNEQKDRISAATFPVIDKYLKTHSNQLNLSAHLIQPVQRGPRYSMLVAAIKKENEHLSDNNKAELAELDRIISDALTHTNSSMPKEQPYYFGQYTYEFFWGKAADKPSANPSSNPMHTVDLRSSTTATPPSVDDFVLIDAKQADPCPDEVTNLSFL